MSALPSRADVVIAGAGIAGLALARVLEQRGVDVVVVDCASPPDGATRRAAWMIRTDSSDPAIAPLAERAGELWRSGAWGRFEPCGGFLIGPGNDDVSQRVPGARGRGTFRAQDGVADAEATLAMLQPSKGVLRGDARDVASECVVNATGEWTEGLPLQPLKRHVAITDCRSVPADAPFVWDLAEHFYFRPHPEGLLLCACDEAPARPGDTEVDGAAIERILATAARLQPGLGTQRLVRAWSGLRTFAPDRRPVVGRDPRQSKLFHLCGLGGHGITLAPVLAKLAADAILGGDPPELHPFAPARLLNARTSAGVR